MFELAIKDHIASAHFLRGYDGPCKDLHGHTWSVEVTVTSEKLNDIGLVVDFREIKTKLKDFLAHLDHAHLNEIEHFKKVNPSSENIAKYIYTHFAKDVAPLTLKKVQVWESSNASVSYFE